MRFMEGTFQLDFYRTDEASQHHIEDAPGYQLYQIGGIIGAAPVRS